MKTTDAFAHPYHWTQDKNLIQRLIDIGVPAGLFWAYFQYYNFGKFTPSEMVKTTGLLAIALLSLTLIAGPIARFAPALDILKAHRKFWGICSFIFVILHAALVIIFYFKFNVLRLLDTTNPKFLGLFAGVVATAILSIITLTSKKSAIKKLNPKVWKAIQTTSYLALLFAFIHFYLVEQVNGVLVIKRLLGQVTFGFAAFVMAIRLLVLLTPSKKH